MDGLLERLAREVAAVVALAVAVAGCATGTPAPCAKTRIVVAQKDERTRMEERRTPRVTGSGAIEDTTEMVRITEYWVRDDAGAWHRITEREFEVVTPGQPLEVCR